MTFLWDQLKCSMQDFAKTTLETKSLYILWRIFCMFKVGISPLLSILGDFHPYILIIFILLCFRNVLVSLACPLYQEAWPEAQRTADFPPAPPSSHLVPILPCPGLFRNWYKKGTKASLEMQWDGEIYTNQNSFLGKNYFGWIAGIIWYNVLSGGEV